jgi:hypothetical protein
MKQQIRRQFAIAWRVRNCLGQIRIEAIDPLRDPPGRQRTGNAEAMDVLRVQSSPVTSAQEAIERM